MVRRSKKIRVAVLGGGFSNERDISLRTSKQVALALPASRYDVSFIEITPERRWVLRDVRQIDHLIGRGAGGKKKSARVNGGRELMLRAGAPELPDVVFIALHGKYGEDGRVQAVLDLLGIPYTGSGVLASALGMDKLRCLELARAAGVRTPGCVALTQVPQGKVLDTDVRRRFGYPCVVKPNQSGSSVGVTIVRRPSDLLPAVRRAFREDSTVLVEEFVDGRELTCGVLGNSSVDPSSLVALPPVEIVVHDQQFFDYQAKYFSPSVEEICPAAVSRAATTAIQSAAKRVHALVGCDGLTRSDFILSRKNNQLYFLEVNTIPGQTEASLCPKEAAAVGIPFAKFIELQITLALKKARARRG